ncbi:MAG TPA: hypothetical protein P5333_15590 [Caldilinea sp.]|nr:hypothetical protein [Caldilinea sp.]
MALWIDRIIKPSETNEASAASDQIRSDIAVVVTVLFALLLALGIRNQVYSASNTAMLDDGALRFAYPERWVARQGDESSFSAVNLGSASTYDARLEVTSRPLREGESLELARFDRGLKLASSLDSYRELEAAEMQVLNGVPALVATYAYVADPTHASGAPDLPVVVEGQDVMFVLGDRFYVVALTADATEWEAGARDFAIVTDSLRLTDAPARAPAPGFQGGSNTAEGGN